MEAEGGVVTSKRFKNRQQKKDKNDPVHTARGINSNLRLTFDFVAARITLENTDKFIQCSTKVKISIFDCYDVPCSTVQFRLCFYL